MSKRDQGKHVVGTDKDGNDIVSKKRLDSQRPSKKLESRQNGYADTVRIVDSKLKGGFHKPGSQNRNK